MRVHIYQASRGTMDGEITDLGIFSLDAVSVELETRRASKFGNGCPSDWINNKPEVVRCVEVGSRRYILPNTADLPRIVIHHDECFGYMVPLVRPDQLKLAERLARVVQAMPAFWENKNESDRYQWLSDNC